MINDQLETRERIFVVHNYSGMFLGDEISAQWESFPLKALIENLIGPISFIDLQ